MRHPIRRWRFLLLAAAIPAMLTTFPAATSAQEGDTVRVVHLVVDGLHPDQIDELTPNLLALKESSVWYEQHRSVMASETLPNHVAMATGTYPDRNTLPQNEGRAFPGDQAAAEPHLGADPAWRTADSLVTAIERVCPDVETATIFAKNYVWSTFRDDGADFDFDEPTYNLPVSDHALDVFTAQAIRDALSSDSPPGYLFGSLGDVDRAGHIDATGWTGVHSIMRVALTNTDDEIGMIVDTLHAQGLWEDTVLVIGSDHSQEWSNPLDNSVWIGVEGLLESDPATQGRFLVVAIGGTAQLNLLDPDAPEADEVLKAARELLTGVAGVREVMYREPNPLDPGQDVDSLHPDWHANTHRLGEAFVVAESGHHTAPYPSDQSFANHGFHGHGETRHATLMITGGWDGLTPPTSIAPSDPEAIDPYDDTAALPEQSEMVDLAPTYGWLLGVPDPGVSRGEGAQWQGRVLEEAFARQPAPACQFGISGDGVPVPTNPDDEGSETPVTGGGIAILAIAAAAAGARLLRRR